MLPDSEAIAHFLYKRMDFYAAVDEFTTVHFFSTKW
jgi:hypothetical protein